MYGDQNPTARERGKMFRSGDVALFFLLCPLINGLLRSGSRCGTIRGRLPRRSLKPQLRDGQYRKVSPAASPRAVGAGMLAGS
jgi:hypothetical protein